MGNLSNKKRLDRICFAGRCEFIALRSPGFVQASVVIHDHPFGVYASPMEAAGETFRAFARNASASCLAAVQPTHPCVGVRCMQLTLRRAESQ